MDNRELIRRMQQPARVFSDCQRKRMAQIVNECVAGTEFVQIVGTLQADDFLVIDTGKIIWQKQVFRMGGTLL